MYDVDIKDMSFFCRIYDFYFSIVQRTSCHLMRTHEHSDAAE